jgi:hypothetical protein
VANVDTKYEAKFFWNARSFERVSVRSRGSSSRNPLKPGLRIDFDNYVKGQLFDGMKSLVFDNNIQDLSMVKERTAMKLLRAMNVPAPREASIRLFVDGRFAGLYTVVEPIDEIFSASKLNESAGTLFEFNAQETPFNFQDLGSDPAAYVPDMLEPKNNEDNPGAEQIVRMVQALNSGTDAEFEQKLNAFFNVDELISYMAAQQYVADVDGLNGWRGANNFYLFQRPTESGALFRFIAWDADLTFYDPELSIHYNFENNPMTRRILQIPSLRQKYVDALRRTADVAGNESGWLASELANATRQVRSFAYDDPSVTCADGQGGTRRCAEGEGPFAAESEKVRRFGEGRFSSVQRQLAELQSE